MGWLCVGKDSKRLSPFKAKIFNFEIAQGPNYLLGDLGPLRYGKFVLF
jgi:hypothetical protein